MPGGTVDALNVKISSDISKLQSGLKKCMSQLTGLQTTTAKTANKMQSSFSRVGDSIKKVAGMIGAAFAVNEIKKFGQAAIEAASDLAEVQNVVDTVFGSMSDNINAWSKSAMTAFGLSETSAKQFTSTMGAMLKSSGITGRALETMSINMAALSADMASFYNLDAQTAFMKIRAGISGETEPLKQLGINMSVANLEAYALSKGITKSYQAMSQSEQMILRYNYLLSVTADAQHDFERTSSGWANQTRILSENFNRLKTIIGTGLIQALTPLLNMLNTLIAKVVEFAQAVAKAFGAGGEDDGMSGLSDDAAGTAEGLEDADKAAKKLNNTLGGIDELNIIGDNADASSITDQLGNLKPISVYDTVGKGLDGISEKMTAFVDKLKEKLQPVAQLAKDIKQSFEDAFKGDLGDSLITNLKEGFWTLVDIVAAFAEAFDKAWANNDNGTIFLESVGNALNTLIDLANSVGQAIADALKSDAGTEWIESIIAEWKSFFDMVRGIGDALNEAWNDNGAGQAFVESLLGAWTGLNDAIAAVRETIAQVFESDVGQSFFANLIQLGANLNQIIGNIAETFAEVWATTGVGESIIESLVNSVTNLIKFVSEIAEKFSEAWNEAGRGEAVVSAILGLIDAVAQHIENVTQIWAAAFENDTVTQIFADILDIITNIVNGITAFYDNLMTAAENSGALQQALSLVLDVVSSIISAVEQVSEAFASVMASIDWSPIMDAVSSLIQSFHEIWSAIKPILEPLGQIAGALLAAFGATVQAAIIAVAASLKIIATAISALSGPLGALSAAFSAAFSGVASVINGIVQTISGIGGVLSSVGNSIASGIGSAFSTLSSMASSAVSTMGSAFMSLGGVIGGALSAAFSTVASTIGSVFSGISSTIASIAGTISSGFGAAFDGISDIVGTIASAIGQAFSAVGGVIASALNPVEAFKAALDGIASAASGVASAISSAFSAITGAIESAANAVQKFFGALSGGSSVSSSIGAITSSLNISSIPTAAGGGQFTRGDIFIANERGPELVGAFGGGSGVMNNNQIVDAVSTGVASAISPLIENMRSDKQEIVSKIRGNDLLLVMQRASKQRGTTISNNFAFGGA